MECLIKINSAQLARYGLKEEKQLIEQINSCISQFPAEQAWHEISQKILNPSLPFSLHLFIISLLFPLWKDKPETAPIWIPSPDIKVNANITKMMKELGINQVQEFHTWTLTHLSEFWLRMLNNLHIQFHHLPEKILASEKEVKNPQWLYHAKINIVDSCFTAPGKQTALIYLDKNGKIKHLSYSALKDLMNQVANNLVDLGMRAGDVIGIDMPMTPMAIVIYLAIIKIGGTVVTIADSFASPEIAVRLKIAQPRLIFTQDVIQYGEKKLPLYEKVAQANPLKIIVLPENGKTNIELRSQDRWWQDFFKPNTHNTESYACNPLDTTNILFSSGTTGDPKAIPWNHTTAIKAAADAYLHQNIQAGDILAWPTNLGWMMGPWLIYAGLINQASIALYTQSPNERAFGEFVQDTKVNVLGVVPSLVSTWKQNHAMENLDWSNIKLFSSSGECSNTEDYLYLMYLAGYKPIIEYCGGTEIGGGYISSTVIENNYLTLFSTPTMGNNFIILDENGNPSDKGEVALIPPAMGLSYQLLNADHEQIYFANMPQLNTQILRRHGDSICRLASGYFRLLGRTDDTMNLGGIKVGAAEIERVVIGVEGIREVAAVDESVQGPGRLIIYVVTQDKNLNMEELKHKMQIMINQHLNPLFKIHKLKLVEALPKTASNKVMRRILKD